MAAADEAREMPKNQISGRLTNGTKWEQLQQASVRWRGRRRGKGWRNCKPCLALHKYFDRTISAYELCVPASIICALYVCLCVCILCVCAGCNWKMQQLQQTKITKVATKLRQKCGKMKWSNGQGRKKRRFSLSNHIPGHAAVASHWSCQYVSAVLASLLFPPLLYLPLSLRLPNDIKLAANKSRQRPTELPCPMQDAASSVHGTRNIAVITTYKKFQQSSALSLSL